MGIAKKCTKNDTITGIFNKCPFLGSGPDKGRSPVEWGNFPPVHPSVFQSIRPRPNRLAGWP